MRILLKLFYNYNNVPLRSVFRTDLNHVPVTLRDITLLFIHHTMRYFIWSPLIFILKQKAVMERGESEGGKFVLDSCRSSECLCSRWSDLLHSQMKCHHTALKTSVPQTRCGIKESAVWSLSVQSNICFILQKQKWFTTLLHVGFICFG